MADVHTPEQRSYNMSRIKGRNTKPELIVRSALHRAGFRFRLHVKDLPGKPDIVLAKYKAVIFVNGCFWHYHDCDLFQMPVTRQKWWKAKLERTYNKDRENVVNLLLTGWRVLIIWECAFRNNKRIDEECLVHAIDIACTWLKSGSDYLEINKVN